jgi:hypothetical protein
MTSCVVQIEPTPIPTRSASAPASIKCAAYMRVQCAYVRVIVTARIT